MKSCVVILMDCWEYSDADPMRVADLRSKMCTNINHFFLQHQNTIQATINACYNPGKLHHEIDTNSCPGYVDATEPSQLLEIIEKTSANTVWYLGMHWNRCIRSRPLGYAVVKHLLSDRNKPVQLLAKQSCTLELIEVYPGKQHSPTYERVPNFAQDTVTELTHVEDDVYEIVGIRKDWDGKLR
jgi:hypothetical protein